MIPAASERSRQIMAASGAALIVLLCLVQPWHYVEAFVYPPHAKMLLLSFGAMPPSAAIGIWIALNLFCLWRAGELLEAQLDLTLLAWVTPLALLMVATGYPAGFLALMATITVTRGHDRPALAGLCLAMMSVHPQLAFVCAVLLLLFGYRRAVLLATLWIAALVVASLVTVGPQAWTEYLGVVTTQSRAGVS
jgi:hypothetical protein